MSANQLNEFDSLDKALELLENEQEFWVIQLHVGGTPRLRQHSDPDPEYKLSERTLENLLSSGKVELYTTTEYEVTYASIRYC